MAIQTASDEKLIVEIGQGSSKALEFLVVRYQKQIYGFLRKFTGDVMMAEELTQETWIRVVKGASHFQPTGKVSSWLYTIAKNLALNEFRKRNWQEELLPENIENLTDLEQNLESQFSALEQKGLLMSAIEELPDRQRMALMLYVVEEKSLNELAVELGLQVNAVKALIHRSKENLQKKLRGAIS